MGTLAKIASAQDVVACTLGMQKGVYGRRGLGANHFRRPVFAGCGEWSF